MVGWFGGRTAAVDGDAGGDDGVRQQSPAGGALAPKKGSALASFWRKKQPEQEEHIRPGERERDSLDLSEHGTSIESASPSPRLPTRLAGGIDSSLPGSGSPLPGAVQSVDPYDASRAQGAMRGHHAGDHAYGPNASHPVPDSMVRVQPTLINHEYDDSESSDDFDDQATFDRLASVRAKMNQDMQEETKKKQTAKSLVRFERRKRQIADRFRTRRDMIQSMEEEGPSIGGQWIDQKWVSNKKLNVEKDQFTIRKWAKDLCNYLLLLFSFTYLIYTSSGDGEFVAYQRAWRQLVKARIDTIYTPESVLTALDKLILTDIAFNRQPYVANFDPPGGPDVPLLLGSIPIGRVQMRQLRVKGQPCSRVQAMLRKFGMLGKIEAFTTSTGASSTASECYPAYTKLTEEVLYSKENGLREAAYDDWKQYPYFNFEKPMETSFEPTVGTYATYGAGGFLTTFEWDNANETMSQLISFQWIDKKTRALFIDFSFYNDDLGLFVRNNILIEFASGQAPVPKVEVFAISPMRVRSGTAGELMRLTMLILVFVMVLYYIIEELDACRALGADRYKVISWAYLDGLNISLFVLSGCLQAYNVLGYEIAIPGQIEDEGMLIRVAALGRSQYFSDKIEALNGFLLWLKLFKYVTFNRALTRMGRVIGACIPDILTYSFLFFVVLVAFSLLGHLFCGNELQNFSTMEAAMLTILRAMFGDIDFDSLVAVSGVTGFIYLGLWIISSNVIFLNMFIAILKESYSQVSEAEKNDPTETTWEKILAELERRRVETVSLKAQAIAQYGKKKYREEQRQRKKSVFLRLFAWAKFKITGKVEEESEDEEEEDAEEEEVDEPVAGAHAKRPQKVSPSRSRRTLTSSREKMSSLCCEKLSAFVLTVKLSPAFPRISQLASLAWTPWQTRVEPFVPEGKTKTVRANTASSFPPITAGTEVTPQGNKRLQSSAEVVDFTDRVESTVSCSSPRALDTVADGARPMQGAAESPDPHP